jgi:hypothetical protein
VAAPRFVVQVPPAYAPERRYVLDLILGEWLGFECDLVPGPPGDLVIRLDGDPEGRLLSLPDALFATPAADWLSERAMPALPLARIESEGFPAQRNGDDSLGLAEESPLSGPLPVIYGDGHPGSTAWQVTSGGLRLAVDVFGSAFFMLSRYEELVVTARDQFGRFPASASVAATQGFLERPIVDEYVDLLWTAMHRLWPALSRRRPEFRLRLTHDVDDAWAAFERPFGVVGHAVAGDVLTRRDLRLAFRRSRSFVAGRLGRLYDDPFDTFDFLMDESERHGLQSTFYFMVGGTDPAHDATYNVEDPRIVALIARINSRGHEVGLHGGFGSFESAERLSAEKAKLDRARAAAGIEAPSIGIRQHYLRFSNPITWRSQEAAGFRHDSTLGYAERVGFRAGTGREYPVYDLEERRALSLRERPLLVMDGTLLVYMGLGEEEAVARAGAVAAAAREHESEAVLLYHNSTLTGPRLMNHYSRVVASAVGAPQRTEPGRSGTAAS